MLARIWGSRGSLASPGPATVKYGGNTPCVEVRLRDGTLIILDAGTGIMPLGVSLQGNVPSDIHLFLTHLHLDHLQGLGFFTPVRDSGVKLHVWGPSSAMKSLEELIEKYLSPPLFPVYLAELASAVEFHDNPTGEWEIGSARVYATMVTHSGPTVGYRIEENGQSLAYIPDHEPGRGVDLTRRNPEWTSGYSVANHADVLIHDSQYFEEEYMERIGWGHSSVTHAIMFTRLCEANKLVMFHHDPLHDDQDLEALLEWGRELWGTTQSEPVLAYEGMEIELT